MSIVSDLEVILRDVEKPGRYTGGEWNSVVKDWESTPVKVALAYPGTYEIGMSNLGLMILYDILNRQPDILCERVYAPWLDMEEGLRRAGLPLYSLETRHALTDFDIVGISLPYELNYTNALTILSLGGMSPLAAERRPEDPLVIAGGSGAYNPEPMAAFFDLFVIGEGEEALLELVRLYAEWKRGGGAASGRPPKADFLRQAARIGGIYVPALYAAEYHADGRLARTVPIAPDVPARVVKRVVPALPPPPTRLIVPYIETVHDRAMLEIQRGCTQGCRFCQASTIYRPVRERTVDEIVRAADEMLLATGHEEISLVSLSSSDHSQIEHVVRALAERCAPLGVSISLPSLRADAFSVRLAEMVQTTRKTGLTFAPEAGSQRLRDAINKKVSEEDLLRTAEAAFGTGWNRIKLYFMVGQPTETDEDVEAIGDLVRKVVAVGRRHRGGRAEVSVSVATFVPKPHTPFQWEALVDDETLRRRLDILRRGLRVKGVQFSWHDPGTTLLEAALSRGDRRVGAVIYRAWQLGARFDAWGDAYRPEAWEQAWRDAGLSPEFYGRRPRDRDEALPWDHIDIGVRKEFLWRERERCRAATPTPDCREGCVGCGVNAALPLAGGTALCP
ncbi:MAG: TIGR03960 family B12-binding radical SAM protein [Anaerolineae bacterium]|nr:TIGR03960 family B12-binding radical SAM protein [Anaerolineae bacterium]